mmetsp:Transcript_18737/g.38056  ORF Transcript_18737/g.38056 Transcript_18737/m.38056 type:complete len:246 (+) Transcript_18737:1543-2280(+)
MVDHLLARVADTRVEKARHIELECLVRLGEVRELRLAADGAGESEDTTVFAEHIRCAHAGVAGLREWLDAAHREVKVAQPRSGQRHLGNVAVGVENDNARSAVPRGDDAVLLVLLERATVMRNRLRELPDLLLNALRARCMVDALFLERSIACGEGGRALCVLLNVERVRPLVDNEVVHLIYYEDRASKLLVELPLNELAQEAPINGVLEAVDNLGVLILQAVAALDVELGEKRAILLEVTREQP